MIEQTLKNAARILPGEGEPFRFGDVGGRFKIDGEASDGRFAVAQLPEIPATDAGGSPSPPPERG